VAIPGTTQLKHLEENLGAAAVVLSADTLQRANAAINRHNVKGARYNAAAQADVDTEEF